MVGPFLPLSDLVERLVDRQHARLVFAIARLNDVAVVGVPDAHGGSAPDEVLLGVSEIAEALGRPASWVCRRTGPKAQEPRLKVLKLGGEVVIRAEDLRRWVRVNLNGEDR